MIPRTKLEKQVAELSGKLRPLTPKEIERAKNHAILHVIWNHSSNKFWCSQCGHEWRDNILLEKATCPHCGARHKVECTKKRKFEDWQHFTVVDVVGGFQVVRTFRIYICAEFGLEPCYRIDELQQSFMTDTGKRVVIARPRYMHWQYSRTDGFNYNMPMTMRKPEADFSDYCIYTSFVITRRVLPILRRNGFDGKYHNFYAGWLFYLLLTDNRAETLAKTKNLDYLLHNGEAFVKDYWPTIKVCIRNQYKPKDYNLWHDMVRMLREDDRDIRSPHYVCPADLRGMHDMVQRSLERKRNAKKAEEVRKQVMRANKSFVKSKSKYFGIAIECNGIVIDVLDSVMKYYEEGEAMHHCVYEMGYYKKPKSLCLSAHTKEGKRIATIELSLVTHKVMQCRGACNSVPEYKDEIVAAVENSKHLFLKAEKPKPQYRRAS